MFFITQVYILHCRNMMHAAHPGSLSTEKFQKKDFFRVSPWYILKFSKQQSINIKFRTIMQSNQIILGASGDDFRVTSGQEVTDRAIYSQHSYIFSSKGHFVSFSFQFIVYMWCVTSVSKFKFLNFCPFLQCFYTGASLDKSRPRFVGELEIYVIYGFCYYHVTLL